MKRLLLAGAGHAHARVLHDWAAAPVPGVELVVVSPHRLAPYSGMVPGWLAGAYRYEDICIDFAALAAAAGARWLPSELLSVDAQRGAVVLATADTIDYDILSLNVGSTLVPPSGPAVPPVLSVRPLADLRDAWESFLRRWRAGDAPDPLRIAAVGAGAAGFESLLAVLARLRALRPTSAVSGSLLTRDPMLLPGFAPAAVRAARRALARAGVALSTSRAWSEAATRDAGLLLWAAGAQAHAWQRDPARRGGLAVSDRGFVRIDDHLRSVSHPRIFAAGDCAEWATPLPKAGVYAVRMGPVLARNLRAALAGAPLERYVPQRRFLALLATGDGRAIASHGRLGAEGRWAWHWKDRIDRGFLRDFAVGTAAASRSIESSPGDSA